MATITEMGLALSARHLDLPREYTAEELYELLYELLQKNKSE